MQETKYWTLHIFAGIVILVLLFLHMTTMHLDGILGWYNPAGGEGIDWKNMVARAKDILMTATYIILLAAGLYHGMYGFRTVLFEWIPNRSFQRIVSTLFILGGFALFILGTWVTIKFHLIAKTL
jgi:succinate dehydrogenase hydrophobic anchor subunit